MVHFPLCRIARPLCRIARPLRQLHLPSACIVFLVGFILGTSDAAGDQVAKPGGPQRVVLLHNGEMLSGIVSSDTESYFIATDVGQVTLPRGKVAHIADSQTGIFAYRAQRIEPVDIKAHCDLAEWCLNHRMLEPAAVEINHLQQLAPADPQVTRLAFRWEFLANLKEPRRTTVGTASLPKQPEAARARPDINAPALSEYTRHVQPLLLNTCATSKCHGAATTATFQLSRPLRGVGFTRRIADRNLAAVLEYVSFVRPGSSALLEKATVAHGGLEKPVLSEGITVQREQLLQLKNWVALVTGKHVAEEPAERRLAETAPMKPTASQPEIPPAAADLPPSETVLGSVETIPATNAASIDTNQPAVRTVRNDPFDPAEFNRSTD